LSAVNPLRVVQVGLGAHGRNWARQVIPSIKEVDLVAYVDTDPNALDRLRDEAHVPAELCFESFKEALAATNPDAVLVTAALPGHAAITKAALEAGLHALVEKPFAPTLDAAKELVEMAAARNLVLMVSQNYRYFPAPRTIATLVHESELGELFQVSIDFRRYSPLGPNGRGRHHLEEQPLLVDMSVHHFDLLRLILSREPQRVFCEAWNPKWTAFSGPSVAVGSIDFDGGIVVCYRGSWISAGPATPWAGEWRLEFEHGEIVWTSHGDNPANDEVVIHPRQGEPRKIALPPMPRTGPSGTMTEFASAIRTGRQPDSSARDNLGTLALMFAAVESATLREPVKIYGTGEAVRI
jgi:predicted dehydrogenase